MNEITQNYRFEERVTKISEAEIEFNLDEIKKEQRIERNKKEKKYRIRKFIHDLVWGNTGNNSNATLQEEKKDKSGDHIADDAIPDFIVFALQWYVETKITDTHIEIRNLYIKYQGTRQIGNLEKNIKEITKDFQPLPFSFSENSDIKAFYKRQSHRVLRIYFPPDSFGKETYGLIQSKKDGDKIIRLLNKDSIIENVMSPLIFPELCSNDLTITVSYPNEGTNGKIEINTNNEFSNLNIEVSPKDHYDNIITLDCENQKKDEEYGLDLNCSQGKKNAKLSIKKRNRCSFNISFDYNNESREFKVYFFSVPQDVDVKFLPSIELTGMIIEEKEIIRGTPYMIDRQNDSLINKDTEKELKPIEIDNLDNNNYIKKFKIDYKSGEVEIGEIITFLCMEGNQKIFSNRIEESLRKVNSFLNSVLFTRSKLLIDNEEKIKKDFGTSVSRDRHFELKTSGDLIDRDWIFKTSDKGINLFFNGYKENKRVMKFIDITGTKKINHSDKWNGKFFIMAGNWVFLLDLAVTE